MRVTPRRALRARSPISLLDVMGLTDTIYVSACGVSVYLGLGSYLGLFCLNNWYNLETANRMVAS